MRNHERPYWNRGDTLRSIKDITVIGALALAECFKDAAAWVDTKLANAINDESDELEV